MPENPDKFDPYYEWLAIAPEDQPPTLYRLLGVRTFEDKPSVIESAADRQMAHLRTFQSGKRSAESQKLLNQVSSARVTLLNPAKKEEYDKLLRERMKLEASGSFLDDESASRHEEISTTLVGFLEAIELAKLKEAAEEAKQRAKPVPCPRSRGHASQARDMPTTSVGMAPRERTLMIGAAIGGGVLLLLVIVVLAVKLGGGPEEKPQPVGWDQRSAGPPDSAGGTGVSPTHGQNARATPPPKPAPDETLKKPDDDSGKEAKPEPPDQKPPSEVPPEEKPPGETTVAESGTTLRVVDKGVNDGVDDAADDGTESRPTMKKLAVPLPADQQKMVQQFDEVYKLSEKRTPEEVPQSDGNRLPGRRCHVDARSRRRDG